MSELFRIYGYISLARASTKERVYGAPLQIRKEKEEEEEERKRKRTMRKKRRKKIREWSKRNDDGRVCVCRHTPHHTHYSLRFTFVGKENDSNT